MKYQLFIGWPSGGAAIGWRPKVASCDTLGEQMHYSTTDQSHSRNDVIVLTNKVILIALQFARKNIKPNNTVVKVYKV